MPSKNGTPVRQCHLTWSDKKFIHWAIGPAGYHLQSALLHLCQSHSWLIVWLPVWHVARDRSWHVAEHQYTNHDKSASMHQLLANYIQIPKLWNTLISPCGDCLCSVLQEVGHGPGWMGLWKAAAGVCRALQPSIIDSPHGVLEYHRALSYRIKHLQTCAHKLVTYTTNNFHWCCLDMSEMSGSLRMAMRFLNWGRNSRGGPSAAATASASSHLCWLYCLHIIKREKPCLLMSSGRYWCYCMLLLESHEYRLT